MLIACPTCSTSYDISLAALGTGRSVRCTRCRNVWFATAPEPEAMPAMMPAMEMAAAADSSEIPAPDEPADSAAETMADTTDFAAAGPADDPAGIDDMAATMAAETSADPAMIDATDAPLAPDEHHFARSFIPGEGPFPMTGGDPANYERRRATNRAKQSFAWRPLLSKIRWPLAPLPTLLLGLGAIVVGLVGWRTDVVRVLPQTASFYSTIGLGVNLRGLEFENIKTTRDIHDGIPVMMVEGEIVSVSRKAVEVPRLRFGVRNGLGAEIYNWTALPTRTVAEPGERVPFRTRLASPPAETHDITVRFHNRRDSIAGLR